MTETRSADLPKDAYPFTMAFIRTDNNRVIDVITIDGPGVVTIRPYAEEQGVPIRVRTTLANGEVSYADPE